MISSNGQVVGYVRVSSVDQNMARQLEAMGTVDRLFQDTASGKNADRPGLAACLAYVREGDVLRVSSIDRLARSLLDLEKLVDQLTAKNVTIEFIAENMVISGTEEPIARLMRQVLAAFAEFERTLIKERQAEGILIAKAKGKYKGRSPKLTPGQIAAAREKIEQGIPLTRIAQELDVNRTTLYRALTGKGTYAHHG